MLQVTKLLAQGHGLAPVLVKRAATVELDWDVRQKSRFEATDSQGRQLGVFLPRGTVVRGGDVLVAEDGSMVRVIAAPQPVMIITHVDSRGTLFDLVRAAKRRGVKVTCGITPAHLFLSDIAVSDFRTFAHLSPPLRDESDRQAALAAVADGTVDVIYDSGLLRAP